MAKKYGRSPAVQKISVFSAAECREIDRRCVQDFGLPTLVLMENAAVQVASAVLELLVSNGSGSVLVVAGTGNNGGDGLAAARHLANAGAAVSVVLVGEVGKLSPDAAVHFRICERMGIRVFATTKAKRPDFTSAMRYLKSDRSPAVLPTPTVVLDALFGTGLSRDVNGAGAAAIASINELGEQGSKIVAIDIPSGLDADSGEIRGAAVRADLTVTFVGMKAGMLQATAFEYVGEVVVAEIGVPRAIPETIVRERQAAGRGKVRNRPGGKTRRGS